MRFGKLAKKACQKVRDFFVKPIRVFCFHQVSDEYNPLTTWKCDWTQTVVFKRNIDILKKKYTFISLPEVTKRLQYDRFRFKHYAALTADDGYQSLLNVIPWLEEQKIPVTLFINTRYLDKMSWSEINEEQARRTKPDVDMLKDVSPYLYLSKDELFSLTSPLVTVGMHGHEHLDAVRLTENDFRKNVERCLGILSQHSGYVPFYAYTWGHHNSCTDMILYENNLMPVLVGGGKNCNDTQYIDRICIDGKKL